MPRKNIDYSNASIYKLCCKDINITEIYVGHTTDMRKRKNRHKSYCNNENDKNYNYNVYQFIRNNGGWDNWDMIEIEKYNAIDGYDVKKRERFWIEELKATLNMAIPTRTIKEWKEENKEIILKQRKEYYKINKESILEYHKEYRKNNKEKRKETLTKYNDNNKEKIKETIKNYYENNKEKISEKTKEKITCECGCIIRKVDLKRHKQTKKHIDLMS